MIQDRPVLRIKVNVIVEIYKGISKESPKDPVEDRSCILPPQSRQTASGI